jgi:hypothetical protein
MVLHGITVIELSVVIAYIVIVVSAAVYGVFNFMWIPGKRFVFYASISQFFYEMIDFHTRSFVQF